MRAFFFSGLCSLLVLGAASVPADAAGGRVMVANHAGTTAAVYVHRGGKEIGRGIVHDRRGLTINTPVDPTGGNVTIELSGNGRLLCKVNASIASATSHWIITATPPETAHRPLRCAVRRV